MVVRVSFCIVLDCKRHFRRLSGKEGRLLRCPLSATPPPGTRNDRSLPFFTLALLDATMQPCVDTERDWRTVLTRPSTALRRCHSPCSRRFRLIVTGRLAPATAQAALCGPIRIA